MKLDDIGFYTLSDKRVKQVSLTSPMWRGELIVTGKCNFKCPYCRGTPKITQSLKDHLKIIQLWAEYGLKNIRFSGGEPTVYPYLIKLVDKAKELKCEHIAISTNGSADISVYLNLIRHGVNDFSVSLDACCSSTGDTMAGISLDWNRIIYNIRRLSEKVYTTVGIVLTKNNINEVNKTIYLAHTLGVSDIRVIPAAQETSILKNLSVSQNILESHPILNYRINNMKQKKNVRGLTEKDSNKCPLVLDDSAVMNGRHYPCIIYLREKGKPIGKVSNKMRLERFRWFSEHKTHNDIICKNNCLDVCIEYNNEFKKKNSIGKVRPCLFSLA